MVYKRSLVGSGRGGNDGGGPSRRRIFSATLMLTLMALALTVGLSSASGDDDSEHEAATPAPQIVSELPGARTATSNTFALSDGSRETVLFQAPVNFKDEGGNWKPINEDLQEQADGSGLANGANAFDLSLPERIGDGAVRLDTGEDWVSQELLGFHSDSADVEENEATYDVSGHEVSFELISVSSGVKEAIVLADPSQPRRFRFKLDASAGVTPELQDDGSIQFIGNDGSAVAAMPAPFLEDSAEKPNTSNDVRYELEPTASGDWTLTVNADSDWLSDPDLVWPVKIDPTTVAINPSLDCEIYVYEPTGGGGGICSSPSRTETYATARRDSSGLTIRSRGLLKFNLSAIPKTSAIMDASLALYHPVSSPLPEWVLIRPLTNDWDSTATWTKRLTAYNWATPGGDFGGPGQSELSSAAMGTKAQWWIFQSGIRTLVSSWVYGGAPNWGVLVKIGSEASCSEPCNRGFFTYYNGAYPTTSLRPQLKVLWVPEAPADSKITSPTDGTKTAKRFLLTSAWEHSGVDGVTFQYRKFAQEGKPANPWSDIPTSQVIDGNNQTVTWPYSVKPEDRASKPLYWDASSVTTGTSAKVQIRAVLAGSSGADGYTTPVEGELDKSSGSPKDGTTQVGPGTLDLLTGGLTISRADVSIPAFNSSLEFSRSFDSRQAGVEATGILGPGWKPASPMEEAGGSSWSKVQLNEETEEGEEEGETLVFKWATLVHSEGGELAFEESGGQFITPPEISGYVLYRLNGSEIALTDPSGNRTVFSNGGSGNEYLPISVAMTGGPGNKSRMIYEFAEGKRRLKKIIAPAAPGISCLLESDLTFTPGCRGLGFTYQSATKWGAPASAGARLEKITYYAPGQGGPWDVAQYTYNPEGRLAEAWDPRVSPALKETYTYGTYGLISSLKPAGQLAWTLEYASIQGDIGKGRLKFLKRSTLVGSHPTAQTTIQYKVPVSGSGGPYDMSGAKVGEWGQEDLPTDATAIFGPDEVPANPPTSYGRATLYYMDAEGQISNVATPSGAGTSAASITTTETDRFGNVVRELSAQNRLRALAAGGGAPSVARSREIDTQFIYSKDGTELQEEIGPMHQVRLESGTTTQARLHRAIQYDANFKYMNGTTTPSPGETKPHVPTSETTGALLTGGSIVDKRSTEYRYSWTLRRVTEQIADAGGLEETKTVTVYDSETGQPTEIRQPSNVGGGGAGTTKIVYYKSGASGKCYTNLYAGLPCRIEPAAQPGTAGQPQLPVKSFEYFNQLGEPLEVIESPGGGSEEVRKTVLTYDAAGRQKTSAITGGGVATPKSETLYSSTLGVPTTQQIVCPESEPACDTQAATTTYDTLGRMTKYQDADGGEATITYDYLGRPVTANDGKGTQTMRYDSVTGLLVELEDSAAGLFTASYDADGQLVSQELPNGLTRETSYDETGSPNGLTYTKASNCGASCTWLSFAVERSINGQILLEDGTLGKDEYAYDKLGRLIGAKETPTGGSCTTRNYKYDKDSNRTEMTTIPGVVGMCSSSGGATQQYSYDSADRLLSEGLSYDGFGRITSLPGALAGGKALSTEYFSNDMVATQSQNGVTNSFELDAMLRQRQRLQAGGLEGVEVFHYAGPGDSPSWTQRGSAWTRSIAGVGGELAAIQESGEEVELQLTNLHGDVTAKAALSPTATELKATLRFDEFGNPTGGSAGRFGWLGGKQRRTELPSGVIQMGVRSYVPAIGRFLTPDPILGGSANPYDYANQDPINNLDLAGTACTKNHATKASCRKAVGKGKKRVREAIKNLKTQLREARARASARVALPGGGNFRIPFEDEVKGAISKAEMFLQGVNEATSCSDGGVIAGGSAVVLDQRAKRLLEAGSKFGAGVSKAAERFAVLGVALSVSAVIGLC